MSAWSFLVGVPHHALTKPAAAIGPRVGDACPATDAARRRPGARYARPSGSNAELPQRHGPRPGRLVGASLIVANSVRASGGLPHFAAPAPPSWSSIGLPSGSSTRICFPPGPTSTAFRKCAPAVLSFSISAFKSGTYKMIRFHPPGSCFRPSGIGRAPDVPGPLVDHAASRPGVGAIPTRLWGRKREGGVR